MLVMQRRIDESIVCTMPDGREIIVVLTSVSSATKAGIGISAPADVKIMRSELIQSSCCPNSMDGRHYWMYPADDGSRHKVCRCCKVEAQVA